MEVHENIQDSVIKTISKKKICKKAKCLSQEALQTAEKRKEVKEKGEKQKYTHLNAEFQRLSRRDMKAFLSDQYKEIEENNRMGKTRDPFKKTRDTKRTLHAKMGTIKDRSSMDLKKPLDESERGERKSWLKAQHSENEDHGIWSHHFMANRCRNSVRLYFGGLQNHCRW